MTTRPRQLSLNFNISGVGHHTFAWRHPASRTDRALDLDYYVELARVAEAGKFDSIFIADTPALRPDPNDALANTPFEPITLLAAIAASTTRIGLIPTISTSYGDPFTVARQIASLDLLSKGRAGVNLVTSAGDAVARNHGRTRHIEHADRYARAREFAEILQRLWTSWTPDAVVADREGGVMIRPGGITPIGYRGDHFQVAGPLNVPRSPQGRPVIVQAGASPAGIDLAAAYADAVYARSMTIEETRGTYRALKQGAAARGRDVKVLPGVVPYVAATEKEARELVREIEERRIPNPAALTALGGLLGVDLTGYDADDKVPLHLLPRPEDFNGSVTGFVELRTLAAEGDLTLGELAGHLTGLAPLGMWALVGDPVRVADQLQYWFEHEAADGFNLMMPIAPGGIEAFVALVVPILQERGLVRADYEGATLRSHLDIEEGTA
ncbi:NtaA/DmoA family FMN-dependent monooxygenase [Herbidospora yilanensis]|uniref:NtaA/DmoA family FMN-dependent monooxygenase n=1 Tax=Herbidospora yilanensis TaxID=354426 RepID=UPI000785618D|nr:NtaA/DmoA family FMN-dependent monooxygenase [Herbidospora yilanensis]